MKRQVVTEEDIYKAHKAGLVELVVDDNALVTPQAVDTAREQGLRLIRASLQSAHMPAAEVSKMVGFAMAGAPQATVDERILPDIRELDLFSIIPVQNPKDPVALAQLKKTTPARIGLDRAGPRYKTKSLLRFKADHAAAVDAAFTDVSQNFLTTMKLEGMQTLCRDREEFLKRPDLGRTLDNAQLGKIRSIVGPTPQVLVYFADGLSSTALEVNAANTYQSLVAGLQRHGIKVAPPFFVKYCRVPAQDCISDATGAEVICTLIGERPGLFTAESMSAYFSYRATTNMPEARRTVISNIHKGGTPAVEAGAYIADIIKLMLEKKAGGTDLPL